MIGLVMYVASLCAFPALISREPLSLVQAGATVTKEFSVPVDKDYAFDLEFVFPSRQAFERDDVVGSRYDEYCGKKVKFEDIPAGRRQGLGRPIPIHVLVRRKSDRKVVVDQTFVSLCKFAHGWGDQPDKLRSIGWVELRRGDYIAEVTNLEAQQGLEGVRTSFSLVAGHGK